MLWKVKIDCKINGGRGREREEEMGVRFFRPSGTCLHRRDKDRAEAEEEEEEEEDQSNAAIK